MSGMTNEKDNYVIEQKSSNEGYAQKPEVAVEKVVIGDEAYQEAMLKNPPRPFSKASIFLYLFSAVAFCCSTTNGYDGSLFGYSLLSFPKPPKQNKSSLSIQHHGNSDSTSPRPQFEFASNPIQHHVSSPQFELTPTPLQHHIDSSPHLCQLQSNITLYSDRR